MAVVLFHAEVELFPLGYLGVDVFFVISGFVVTPLIIRIFETPRIYKSIHGLRDFYKRRFFRLAPALFSTLTFSAMTIFLLGSISEQKNFALQGLATLLLFGNLGAYKYTGNYFQPNTNPLIHTWSLSVEEQIYIFLPLVIFLLFLFHRNIRKVTIASFSILSIFSFISFNSPEVLEPLYSKVGISSASLFSFYSPFDRVWQFLLGGLLSLVFVRQIIFTKKIFQFLSILITTAALFILFSSLPLNSRIGSILVTLLTCLIIAFRSLEKLPLGLSRVLIWIGDRSYSIYLIHMPLVYLANHSIYFSVEGQANRLLRSFLTVVLTIVLGSISYSQVENRFRQRTATPQKLRFEKSKVTAAIAIPISLFCFVLLSSSRNYFQDPGMPPIKNFVLSDLNTNCKFDTSGLNFADPCLVQSPGSARNFLLIGDSHAAALSPAIISISRANKANVYVFTYGGCPFISALSRLSESSLYPHFIPECINHNKKIIEFLSTTKIDTIFYSQRSTSIYVTPYTSESRLEVNNKIRDDLARVEQMADNFIFLGITPEYEPKDTVISWMLGQKGSYSPDPASENGYWKSIFVGKESVYIDLYSLFCRSSTTCINKIGNEWLFSDKDHLATAGAELAKAEITRAMNFSKL